MGVGVASQRLRVMRAGLPQRMRENNDRRTKQKCGVEMLRASHRSHVKDQRIVAIDYTLSWKQTFEMLQKLIWVRLQSAVRNARLRSFPHLLSIITVINW